NEPSLLSSSDATLLRRTAPVVRDGRHVDDVGDLVADVVERTYGRLAARTRTLDAHFQRLHAVVERGLACLLGGDLRGERGRLARTAETRAARGRPRQRVALAVGDRDDGVVERSVDVGDAVGDDALDLLLRLCSGWLGHDRFPLLPDGPARTLAGAGIGPGALAAQRQAAAVAQAAVAGQVHQALDGHADLAAEVALDHVLADFGAQALDFRLGQVADLRRRVDAGSLAKLPGTGTANAVDALQPDPDMLLGRQVDTCNTRHARSPTVWRPDREIRRSEHEILTGSRVVRKGVRHPAGIGPSGGRTSSGMGSVPMLRQTGPRWPGCHRWRPVRPAPLKRGDRRGPPVRETAARVALQTLPREG